MICVRVRESEIKLIKKVCRARDEDLSSFIRKSVRKELARLSYLSDDEKKALGVMNTKTQVAGGEDQ